MLCQILSKKVIEQAEKTKYLSKVGRDFVEHVTKDNVILSAERPATLVKYHKTSVNPALLNEYFSEKGELKLAELKVMVEVLCALRRTKRDSLYSLLLRYSLQDPEIFPHPRVLMRWLGKKNWSEVEQFFNYKSEVRKKNLPIYTVEFLEKWMDLVVQIFKQRGRKDFSIEDYQALTIETIADLPEKMIDHFLGKENYLFLLKRKRLPSVQIITVYLAKTFNEIKASRGCQITREDKRWNSNKAELLALLVAETKKIGKLPSAKYIIKNAELPSPDTFYKKFEVSSWSEILAFLIKELERLELTHLIVFDDIKARGKVYF